MGLMPSSIGCFIVDMDYGGQTVVAEIESISGPALATQRVYRPGGFHM